MKTPTITAPINKLVKKLPERAVLNKAKFNKPSRNVGNENKEAIPLSPLPGRSSAVSSLFKHDRK